MFCISEKLDLLTLGEEHMLRLFENWMLRRILGS